MQKLDGINKIFQMKFQNDQNTFEATSTTILYGISFQILQKNAKTLKNLKASYIAPWKPTLNGRKDFIKPVLFRNGIT